MRRFIILVGAAVALSGCAMMDDLHYGPQRLKPHEPGAAATYPVQTTSVGGETARPSPGSVAPLHRHGPRRAIARTPHAPATATPSETPGPGAADVAPPASHFEPAPVPAAVPSTSAKPTKLKKCRVKGSWAVWRKKCPSVPGDGAGG